MAKESYYIEKLYDGSYAIYGIDKYNNSFHRRYFGYTKAESIKRFKSELSAINKGIKK